LKWKSCIINIHLPLLSFALKIVVNHSKGLRFVLNKKWFDAKIV
jgi:hypothetical protein